jgi:hypothetical protein
LCWRKNNVILTFERDEVSYVVTTDVCNLWMFFQGMQALLRVHILIHQFSHILSIYMPHAVYIYIYTYMRGQHRKKWCHGHGRSGMESFVSYHELNSVLRTYVHHARSISKRNIPHTVSSKSNRTLPRHSSNS